LPLEREASIFSFYFNKAKSFGVFFWWSPFLFIFKFQSRLEIKTHRVGARGKFIKHQI
jgi:hypothetical protein